MPVVVPYPVTGFNKLLEDNPFVLSQRADTNNTWSNVASYTWIPSAVQGYNKEKTASQYSGSTWTMNQLEQNEFTIDNQNRIISVVEDRTNNYNGFSNRAKFKYQFTYNVQNKASYILVQATQTAPYTNFTNNYSYTYNYNTEGKLISDSLFNYSNQSSYRRVYRYDTNGNLLSLTNFDYSSDDSTSNILYTHVNGRLHTYTTNALNQTSGTWEITSADTFEYDPNGNIIKRIKYGAWVVNGVYIPYMPIAYETYNFNSQNKMDQIEKKVWDSNLSVWINSARYSINYNNSLPSIGYVYDWNPTSQMYNSNPTYRLLFALPTILHEAHNTTISDVEIYPNPAKNKLFISYSGTQVFQQINIDVYNNKGQLIPLPVNAENGIAELDISNLSSGIYYINIRSSESMVKKKLVVTE